MITLVNKRFLFVIVSAGSEACVIASVSLAVRAWLLGSMYAAYAATRIEWPVSAVARDFHR